MPILSFPDFIDREFGSSSFERVDGVISAFENDLQTKAAAADIDWTETRKKIDIPCHDGARFSKSRVVALSSESHGRVFINVYHNTFDFRMRNSGEIIKVLFPLVHLGNYRNSIDSVSWNPISLLWDEYNKYVESCKSGGYVFKKRQAPSSSTLPTQEHPAEEEIAVDMIKKDYLWLKKLKLTNAPGAYFVYKGALELHHHIPLYAGYTSKGVVGSFSGVTLVDEFGRFRGMQRYYVTDSSPPKAKKVYRKGLNPSGAMRPMGDIKAHIDGDMIYLAEQVAGASLVCRLTGSMAVAALYADNILNVAKALRRRFPSSPLILVRDDDREKPGNKGLAVGNEFSSSVSRGVVLCPPFTDDEVKQGASDLSDYWLIHGDNETRRFLLEI